MSNIKERGEKIADAFLDELEKIALTPGRVVTKSMKGFMARGVPKQTAIDKAVRIGKEYKSGGPASGLLQSSLEQTSPSGHQDMRDIVYEKRLGYGQSRSTSVRAMSLNDPRLRKASAASTSIKTAAISKVEKGSLFRHPVTHRGEVSDKPFGDRAKKVLDEMSKRHGRKSEEKKED
jgi:hypothetical protein